MMSYIWLAMLTAGIVGAALSGRVGMVAAVVMSASKEAIQLGLGIAGSMALWSGLARIAESSGLMDRLAHAVRPVISPLFPGLPRRSPALSTIAMSMSANLLGLGNAATPLGLRAMEQMDCERRNRGRGRRRGYDEPDGPDEPTDEMCTFAIITSSSLTLVPTVTLSLRAEMGSADPGAFIGTTIFATFCSTAAAIMLDRAFRCRRPRAVRRAPGGAGK